MITRGRLALVRAEEGGVAVEAGLTLPILLLLVVGTIEFALAFWQVHEMDRVVSQVGRFVMLSYAPGNPVCDTNCAITKIQAAAPFATGSAALNDNSCTVGGANTMKLTATSNSNLSFVAPLVLPPISICVPLL